VDSSRIDLFLFSTCLYFYYSEGVLHTYIEEKEPDTLEWVGKENSPFVLYLFLTVLSEDEKPDNCHSFCVLTYLLLVRMFRSANTGHFP